MGTAAAVVGGSIVSGLISSKGAKSAASSQVQAAREAGEITRQQFLATQATLAPFQTGVNAVLPEQFRSGFVPGAQQPGPAQAPVFTGPEPTREELGITSSRVRSNVNAGQVRPSDRPMVTLLRHNGKVIQESDIAGITQQFKLAAASQQAAPSQQQPAPSQIGPQQSLANGHAEITGSFTLQKALSGALGELAQEQAFKQFRESPGQDFLRQQGMRGLDAELSRTGTGGGTRLKAISEFNQGLASVDFQNQFNRLGSITGTGLSSAQALAGVGTTAAAGQANAVQNAGAARASGQLGQANAFTSGIADIATFAGAGGFGGNNPATAFRPPSISGGR